MKNTRTTTLRTNTRRLSTIPRIDESLPDYERALRRQRKSDRTVRAYVREVTLFAAWVDDAATIADITTPALEDYQTARSEWAPATINRALSAIRSYCRWSIKEGYRADDPTLDVEWLDLGEPHPRALRVEELARLSAIFDRPLPQTEPERWYRARDVRAIMLMLYAGLRLSEAATARWRDLDLYANGGRGSLTVFGKGNKRRVLGVHRRLRVALLAVPEHERIGKDAIAGKLDGTPLKYKSMAHIFERWLQEDEQLDISAHQLRHSFATEMLRGGANLREIQTALGHASLETTMRYLRIDPDQTQGAIDRIPDRWVITE